MKGASAEKALDRFYRRIPTMTCPPGCFRCCGPIWMSRAERDRLPETPDDAANYMCPFIVDGKCSVYEKRPLICRLFGVSDASPLTCFEGGSAERTLSEEETGAIMVKYINFCGGMSKVETVGSLSKMMKDVFTGKLDPALADLAMRQMREDAESNPRLVD